MVTLYKRATPPQAMILRIVEGAYKNACDSHGRAFEPNFARSIAKRASGTLSAELSAVLAAKPSEKIGAATATVMVARSARVAQRNTPSGGRNLGRPRDGAITSPMVAPLRSLEKWMVRQMREIKNAGNAERAEAFIDILRKIVSLKP